MEYFVDQQFFLIDRRDGKKYRVKVLLVDAENKELKVHYIGWRSSFDERIPFDSERIEVISNEGEVEEYEDAIDSSQEIGSTGAAIGRLLMAMDTDSKKVIATFDVRLSQEDNCKNINAKFKVPQLEQCALDLRIETVNDGKKIFNKNKLGLSKAIVQKIESHLPHTCSNCSTEYSPKLGEEIIFKCNRCGVPSHDCDDIMKIKSAFPSGLPLGLFWMCNNCHLTPILASQAQTDEGSISTKPDETCLRDDVEAKNPLEDQTKGESMKNQLEKRQNKSVLCKYYARKNCKHGPKGVGCSFDHPKKCFKYTRHGPNKKHGCTKGKDCQYYHPPLCNNSVKSGICRRKDCHFHHLKGTKFADGLDVEISTNNSHKGDPQQRRMASAQIETKPASNERTPIQVLQRPSYAKILTSDRADRRDDVRLEEQFENNSQNFLELSCQIQKIQAQIQEIMKLNQNRVAGTKTCRCQIMYQ